MPTTITFRGKATGTSLVMTREDKPGEALFTFQMFSAKTGESLAFACSDRARISIDGGARFWVGGACIKLRTVKEAWLVAGTLNIGLEDHRAEAA